MSFKTLIAFWVLFVVPMFLTVLPGITEANLTTGTATQRDVFKDGHRATQADIWEVSLENTKGRLALSYKYIWVGRPFFSIRGANGWMDCKYVDFTRNQNKADKYVLFRTPKAMPLVEANFSKGKSVTRRLWRRYIGRKTAGSRDAVAGIS